MWRCNSRLITPYAHVPSRVRSLLWFSSLRTFNEHPTHFSIHKLSPSTLAHQCKIFSPARSTFNSRPPPWPITFFLPSPPHRNRRNAERRLSDQNEVRNYFEDINNIAFILLVILTYSHIFINPDLLFITIL